MKYRIKRDYNLFNQQEVFIIQMKILFFWITIKTISDKDAYYAKNCAKEVLYYLEKEE